jgi:hypothetical protein
MSKEFIEINFEKHILRGSGGCAIAQKKRYIFSCKQTIPTLLSAKGLSLHLYALGEK